MRFHGPALNDADGDQAVMLYSDQIIRGMERAARRHGYALLSAASLDGGPESLVAKVAGRVDGFAVPARTVPTEDLEAISRRLPVVCSPGPAGSTTWTTSWSQRRRPARPDPPPHRDHGLRRLAFIGGEDDSPDAVARFQGFRQACQEAGLPVPSRPEHRHPDAGRGRPGGGVLDRSEDTGVERPEAMLFVNGAMLFVNDQMAMGALRRWSSAQCGCPRTSRRPASTASRSAGSSARP